MSKLEIVINEVCVENGDVIIECPKGSSIRLRAFQQEVVDFMSSNERYLLLEAPTGSGKTFTMLAPLISNIMYGTTYDGIVGIYPTKPLTTDQFISLINTLDNFGTRIYEQKGVDGEEVIIIYDLTLLVRRGESNNNYKGRERVALIRLTRDILDKVVEAMIKEASGKEVTRITLFNMIKEAILERDVSYIITVTVPEYPYLMMSALYRSFPDAGKLLSLVAEGGFVYNVAKRIVNANEDELEQEVNRIVKVLYRVVSSRVWERGLANIMAVLFPEVLFMDEFHTWNMYEKPTVYALVLLHYMISRLSTNPWKYKIIFSSATPQDDIRDFIEKQASIGKVIRIKAKTISCKSRRASKPIRSKTVVEFYPVDTKPSIGAIAWFMTDDYLPLIVEEKLNEIVENERAIIFGRRIATVEEAANVFYKKTGIIPILITGLKPKPPFLGKEALRARKSEGNLYLFGNYSIELGIDLANIRYGIIVGTHHGELVQRFGRIGRGTVDQTKAVILTPIGYIHELKLKMSNFRTPIDYWNFINQVLPSVIPRKLGIVSIGTEAILRHRIGKLRLYLPLASFVLIQIFRLRDKKKDLKEELCREFIGIVNSLSLDKIFKWLRLKVSKNPNILLHLASFRITSTIKYVREEELDKDKLLSETIKLPEHSLITLLSNYRVKIDYNKYREPILILGKAEKKNISSITKFSLVSLTRNNPILSSLFGNIMSSRLLLSFLELRNRGIIPSCLSNGDNKVLYKVLRELDIPVYIAKPLDKHLDLLKLLQAYGYAIKLECSGEPQAYLLIL
mgnify:CR=1 FL=1